MAAGIPQAWATLEGQKGDHNLADELFQAAAKVEPGNAILLNSWATFRKKSRRDSVGAHQMYADAVSANPDDIHSLQVNAVPLRLSPPEGIPVDTVFESNTKAAVIL